MQVLSQIWDKVHHERQRSEKHQLVHNKGLGIGSSPQDKESERSQATNNSRLRRPSRPAMMKAAHNIDDIQGQLNAMQHMLTPIEIQRVQQHANHIVRIPRR